jgi:hypothetical protein
MEHRGNFIKETAKSVFLACFVCFVLFALACDAAEVVDAPGESGKSAEEITVRTGDSDSFFGALASGRTVVLPPGQYGHRLVHPERFAGYEKSFFIELSNRGYGYRFRIKGLKNLTIRGTATPDGNATLTDLICFPDGEFVLYFEDCENLSVEYVAAGRPTGAEKDGGVFAFENCKGVQLKHVELYGGVSAVKLNGASGVTMEDSKVFSCVGTIADITGGTDILFQNCAFTGNSGGRLFTVDAASRNVTARDSRFENNVFTVARTDGGNVAFENCEFD